MNTLATPGAIALLLVGMAAILLVAAALRQEPPARPHLPGPASLPTLPELRGRIGVVRLGEVYVQRIWTSGPRYRRRITAFEGRYAVLTPLEEDARHGAQPLRLTADEILVHMAPDEGTRRAPAAPPTDSDTIPGITCARGQRSGFR